MVAPLQPVLVYDGSCGFCTRCASWVASKWRVAAKTVPSRRLDDASLVGFGLTRADTDRSVWWIGVNGERRSGHLAVSRALVGVGGGWAMVGRSIEVPPLSWLAGLGYRVVARYRHRLPGGTAACRL